MKTIIIGDNQSINQAFCELLNEDLDCNCTFREKTVCLPNQLNPLEVSADLILIDLSSSIRNSRELVRKVRALQPKTPIIALHFYKDTSLVEEIIEAGASAYLLVNTTSSELKNAICNVMEGKKYITKEIERRRQALFLPSVGIFTYFEKYVF
jgi:DNA-binding NarL/FixJ family response regulator